MRRAFPLLILVLCADMNAQSPRTVDTNRHAWMLYSGDHPIANRFGIHVDGQLRRARFGNAWQQFQLRPGINYDLNANVMLTVGYAYTKTYQYGDFPAPADFPEHRIYQQVMVRQRAGPTRVSHRYRLEQRYIGEMNGVEVARWRYQNRFRYSLKVDVPLGGADDRPKWYLPMYNEILIHFGPNFGASTFDHNRAFVGLGRDFGTNYGRLEIGYMNQLLAQRNGNVLENNHTMVISFTSSAPLRKLFRSNR